MTGSFIGGQGVVSMPGVSSTIGVSAGIGISGSGPTLNLDFATSKQLDSRVTFTRASTATYYDGNGILQTAPTGVPRFDHDPITGQSLGLFIEEQRTNLFLNSSDFNIGWAKNNTTIASYSSVAPDGTQTGGHMVLNSGVSFDSNDAAGISQSYQFTPTTYSWSIYAKAGAKTKVMFRNNWNGQNFIFDLSTGTLTQQGTGTGTISHVGGGWYRCVVTYTVTTGTNGISIRPYDTGTSDGYSGIYIWGAQVEQGSFATSYIPTTTAQVTRVADQASMTGTNFSSWYNQSQGSFYADYQGGLDSSQNGYGRIISFGPSGAVSAFAFASEGSSSQIAVWTGGNAVARGGIPVNMWTVGGKAIMSYNGTNFAVTALGVTPSTGIINALTNIGMIALGGNCNSASNMLNGHIKKISYYPVALPSANLVALTS